VGPRDLGVDVGRIAARDVAAMMSPATLGPVRAAVRTLLERSPAYHQMPADDRRMLANAMVRVSRTAADLIVADSTLARAQGSTPPLATAQDAGGHLGGQAVAQVAGTTEAVLRAVSFERFVTELINGVFGALVASSIQQMHAYTELLDHVATSTADFTEAATGDDQGKSWLADQFPGSFEAVPDQDADVPEGGPRPLVLQVRDGGSEPTAGQVRGVLGLPPDASVPTDPDGLLPLARRRLGQQRQQVLATLVAMGMQRIVIDGGKINAAMRFHIDAQSAAREDAAHKTDITNRLSASGGFGVGPWSASASEQNTIAYVNTEQVQTNEQVNVAVDLTSSVEILFRSDYVPLNRMANATQINQIMANSRNPDAPIATAPTAALTAPAPLTTPVLPAAPEPARPPAAEQQRRPPQPPAQQDAPRQPPAQLAASRQPANSRIPASDGARPPPAGAGAGAGAGAPRR
jgi:hypothetical protein